MIIIILFRIVLFGKAICSCWTEKHVPAIQKWVTGILKRQRDRGKEDGREWDTQRHRVDPHGLKPVMFSFLITFTWPQGKISQAKTSAIIESRTGRSCENVHVYYQFHLNVWWVCHSLCGNSVLYSISDWCCVSKWTYLFYSFFQLWLHQDHLNYVSAFGGRNCICYLET